MPTIRREEDAQWRNEDAMPSMSQTPRGTGRPRPTRATGPPTSAMRSRTNEITPPTGVTRSPTTETLSALDRDADINAVVSAGIDRDRKADDRATAAERRTMAGNLRDFVQQSPDEDAYDDRIAAREDHRRARDDRQAAAEDRSELAETAETVVHNVREAAKDRSAADEDREDSAHDRGDAADDRAESAADREHAAEMVDAGEALDHSNAQRLSRSRRDRNRP